MRKFLAHISDDGREQTLRDHSFNTAEYAKDALADVGLSNTAYLAGLIHDIGKGTDEFQEYINNGGIKGSVIHSFTAPKLMLTKFHDGDFYRKFTAEAIACATGSHHGLFDLVNIDGTSGFEHRLIKEGIDHENAIKTFYEDCFSENDLSVLFDKSVDEIKDKYTGIKNLNGKKEEVFFYLGLMIRLITSAVMEGDKRDSCEFDRNIKLPKTLGNVKLSEIWHHLSISVDKRIDLLSENANDSITLARKSISKKCRECANTNGKVFRLNVPTGAGKTLSSLRFALAYAKNHQKSRIIYVAPMLSIIDQNATIIRDYINDDRLILEHHSNVVQEVENNSEKINKAEYLIQTWDAPVIITTFVQFLNCLFDGKSSSVRRMHSLCNSVIIIDEVQEIPTHLTSLFNLAVGFLSEVCNTTIILCSATQPYSAKLEHPLAVETKDMVPYDEALWPAFERTKITHCGQMNLDEISEFAEDVLKDANSLLIVCNTKKEAETIYYNISDEHVKYHLSASMCHAHRNDVLTKMQEDLRNNIAKKIVCVSTQVIEAGVDISFESVIRLSAGLDSVVQSAGRCNRNKENNELANVYLIPCKGENLTRLKDIDKGKTATESLAINFNKDPDKYNGNLASDRSVEFYYNKFYGEFNKGDLDGAITLTENECATTLFDLLATNKKLTDADKNSAFSKYIMSQAFKTAGRYFMVYDNNSIDVVVPYDDKAKELIEILNGISEYSDLLEALVNQTKEYTISLYGWQIEKLESEGDLHNLLGGRIIVLDESHYNNETGFTIEENDNMDYLEV